MKNKNPKTAVIAAALIIGGIGIAGADQLTLMVETDLAEMGYDVGPVDGEETMETVIAVSKFQAENQLEVTGAITPQLAGVVAARKANPDQQVAATTTEVVVDVEPLQDPAALQAAQQACLQEKMAAAQEAQKKKRGFGKLFSAVTRTATRYGAPELATTANDVYSANATAEDLASAAKDLGLTEDDIAACQNPGQ
ncbi:MAG: peptidoglycan-binding domain-containing protein [Gammaproteobacteria bacterium]